MRILQNMCFPQRCLFHSTPAYVGQLGIGLLEKIKQQMRNKKKKLEVRIPIGVVEGRSGVAAVARLLPHTTNYVFQ